MTQREEKLISIINEDQDPKEALIIAMKVICDFLKQPVPCQEQHLAYQQELA